MEGNEEEELEEKAEKIICIFELNYFLLYKKKVNEVECIRLN